MLHSRYQLFSSEEWPLSRSYSSNHRNDMKFQFALLTAAACALGATAGIPVLSTYVELFERCSSASNSTVRHIQLQIYPSYTKFITSSTSPCNMREQQVSSTSNTGSATRTRLARISPCRPYSARASPATATREFLIKLRGLKLTEVILIL